MTIEVRVPEFPESVTEGTIVAWYKRPGEVVKRDESLVDIETDKVAFEVPALEDGVLQEILAQDGATVVSGQVIARLTEAAGAAAVPLPKVVNDEISPARVVELKSEPVVAPAARKLIAEHGLDETRIPGSGKGGRVLKEDVLRYLEQGPETEAPAPGAAAEALKTEPPLPSEAPPPPAVVPAPIEAPAGERLEKRVPMTRLRTRIAERLVEAQQTAAILTTFNEVNMQPVTALRERYRERFEKTHGVKLGFMSFFVKAAVEALKRFPEVNASIDGSDIVYHGFFDIGIAVGTPRGLVVPILRDADQLTMAEIEARIRDFSERAQDGRLAMEEITGGTFTITNGGVFGSLLSTPILNPPQSAILGMHKIEQRPVVENGEIVIRPMMYLALSYDHRLIDGREAVRFLVSIKELLEDPARILLKV